MPVCYDYDLLAVDVFGHVHFWKDLGFIFYKISLLVPDFVCFCKVYDVAPVRPAIYDAGFNFGSVISEKTHLAFFWTDNPCQELSAISTICVWDSQRKWHFFECLKWKKGVGEVEKFIKYV